MLTKWDIYRRINRETRKMEFFVRCCKCGKEIVRKHQKILVNYTNLTGWKIYNPDYGTLICPECQTKNS